MASTTYTKILTRGAKAQLPNVEDGKIRFAADSQQLFIDYGSSRIEITDFVKGYTAAQILQIKSIYHLIHLIYIIIIQLLILGLIYLLIILILLQI